MATTFAVSDKVREILARSTITSDRLVLPPQQLDRKTYEEVNRTLSAAGGWWDRKAKAHVFDRDPREGLGLAVESGKVEHRKNTLQAFYTPSALADRLVEFADLRQGDRVLEPSCGDGAIVAALLRSQPAIAIDAYDIEPSALREAARKAEGVEWHGVEADFLGIAPAADYDLVIMNPPFAKDADIDHVMHAWAFVRPGCRLVSIMSATWSLRDGGRLKKRQRFNSFVHSLEGEIVPLGYDAFKEAGAAVNTVMIRLVKPTSTLRKRGASET